MDHKKCQRAKNKFKVQDISGENKTKQNYKTL